MRTHFRRDVRDDRGSIILALLGIVILTMVASVGLTAVVNGQHQTRHDNTFTQSLNNAESGIDAMVATIKSSCASANSGTIAACAGLSGAGYTVTASPTNAIDQSGNASSTAWLITAAGTSTEQGHQIVRTVTETVSIAHTYHAPVLGTTNLSLPNGSSVSNYQLGLTNPSNPTGAATPTQTEQISSGVTLSLLGIQGLGGTIGATNITNIPTGASPGAAETGGTLTLSNSDLQNFAQIALDNGETCATAAGAASSLCNSSTIESTLSPTPAINMNGCQSGIGAEVDGKPILDIPNNILVLNTNVVADNLYNKTGIQNICTNLPIVIPTIGTNLNSLTTLPLLGSLLGLVGLSGTVDVPIGSSCTDLAGSALQALSTVVATGNLDCTMNDPASLVFNETGTSPVYLGTGSSIPTYVSAVVNSNGTCYIDGNVVLYGALNCTSIQAAPGATNVSLTVYYPTDEPALQYADTQHKDTVLNWNESGA
jgi:hypothetical protein